MKVHLGSLESSRAACGVDVARGGWTTNPGQITCRRCIVASRPDPEPRKSPWYLVGETVKTVGSKWRWRGAVCELWETNVGIRRRRFGQVVCLTTDVYRHRREAERAITPAWRSRGNIPTLQPEQLR